MELNVLRSDDPLLVRPNSLRFPVAKKRAIEKKSDREKQRERERERERNREKEGDGKNRWRVTCAHVCQKIAGTFSPRIIVNFSTRLRYKRACNATYRLVSEDDISVRGKARGEERRFTAKGTHNYAVVRSLWKKTGSPYKGKTITRTEKWIDTRARSPVGRR